MLRWIESGELKLRIERTFPRQFEGRKTTGKGPSSFLQDWSKVNNLSLSRIEQCHIRLIGSPPVEILSALSREVFGHLYFTQGELRRVGLYARISTHDQQRLPLQMKAMQAFVRKRRWKLTVQIKEVGSGATLRPQREELPHSRATQRD